MDDSSDDEMDCSWKSLLYLLYERLVSAVWSAHTKSTTVEVPHLATATY
jgi:hypothetical protein